MPKNRAWGGVSRRFTPRRGRVSRAAALTALVALAISLTVAVPRAYAGPLEDIGGFFSNLGNSIASAFDGSTESESAAVELYAAGDKGTDVADASTLDGWNAILESEGQATTQNIGRIWTDKSVFTGGASFTEGPLAGDTIDVQGDHDFLVGLSALSSTSNLTSTTYTSQPLDIVLVLDDSGSMAYSIDSDMPNQTVYTPVPADEVVESHGHINDDWHGGTAQQDTRGGEYYAQVGDEYVRIHEETNTFEGDWWTSYEEHVRWTLNGQEVNPETTQFYTRTVFDMSERRGALQYAVSNFIDQTAAMNATIADENNKIRLSLVVFEDNATVENHLTVCEGDNVADLKATLSDLRANGATNAGAGMTSANNELRQNSTRENTKQVVIFFTDGVPTTSSTFSNNVANIAVNQAGQIKNRGGSVYSVGIFDGANPNQTDTGWNPDDTDRANVFMNAVSSNYPNSTAWNNLGRRASGDPDFYKSAENSGQLNEVFQDIFDESTDNAASGSPIEGTDQEGVQDAVPGTLTFTDPLGDYMEVTGDTMTLVYGDQQYTATKGDDGVYRFPDQEVGGNDVYKTANLSQIKISIQKGTGSNGDTVTVSMPASFIPLRNYEVTTEDGQSTMTVSEAYPIRLFYGVSVKQDVLDNLGDPGDTTLQNYINGNKTNNGASVNFYANKWSGQQYGDATATFTPNEANKFYYYTENTELYVDADCTQRATEHNINQYDTLYYKDTYWVQNGTTGTEKTEVISVSRTGQDMQGLEYDRAGNAYIEAGTQRYDRPATLASDKVSNETKTADQTLNPTWANNGTVSQRLGNNGVIPVELPATLAVSKTVEFGGDYGDSFDEAKYTENKSYEMNIHVDGAAGKTYQAQVKNAQGTVTSSEDFTLTFDGNGDVKHSIKHDETLYIYGLDGGATYTVSETALGDGWTTTHTNERGTLTANSTSTVTVKNTYTLSSTTGVGADIFKGMKVLDGRDWVTDGSDTFTFQITGQNGAPLPDPATVTVNAATTEVDGKDAAPFNFSDVTYDKPGVYTYTIEEIPPTNARPGMSYSNAVYTVEVTVSDNGDGTMGVTSTMTQTRADNAGDPVEGEVADKTATFTNRFTESETTAVLGADKDYQNQSGNAAMDLKNGMFSVELRPTGTNAADAPMPEGTTGGGEDRVATAVNAGTSMNFARIHFTNQMDGQTFTYEISEVPDTVDGVINMDYDDAVYTVKVTVHVDAQNRVSVVTEYFDANNDSLGTGEGGIATQPTFHNVYKPQEATLTDDAGDAIHGEKTLTGRDMAADESFGFTLSARGTTTQNAVANGDIAIAGDNWTASVSGGTNGQAAPFTFGDMTFKKAGTYLFAVQETSHNGEGLPNDGTAGMTYDRDACIVTVTVTDENGELKATVSYNNGANQPTDRAVFQNTYTSSVDFGNAEGGIQITKQLNGRNLTANEFWFEIKAVDAQGAVSATDADAKLSDADRTFSNPTGAGAGNATQPWKQLAGLTFNQADSGKTFVYEVRETSQATETVTTDSTVYTVTLTPQDNGDGTMYVTGSVKGGDLDITIDTRDEDYAAPVLPFENVYTPKPVSTDDNTDTTLQVTKKVTGAPAAGAFDFELTLDTAASDNGADGVFEGADATQAFDGMTATTKDNLAKDEEQTLSFGQLTFTKAGTYTFKVHETTTAPADYWTYDNTEKTITVEVADHDGQLEILYAQGNNPAVENKYTAGAVVVGGDPTNKQITVKKTVTGHASASEFNFKLEPVVEQGDEAKWQTVSSVDQSYDGLATVAAGIAEDESSTATFGGIKFSAANEFKFKVTEAEAQSAAPAGWTYDTHESFVTVKVTDDGQGQLHADVTYDNAGATTDADKGTTDAAAFTNSYSASGSLDGDADGNLTVTKNYTSNLGDPWTPGDSFSFVLAADTTDADTKTAMDNDWITLPDNASGITVTDKSANHQASFGDIVFKHAGTYKFTVHEVLPEGVTADSPTKDGVTYDTSTKTVTVEVVDDGAGKLTATVADSSDELTFTNTYSVGQVKFRAAYFKLQGNKVLDGRTWEQGDTFTFTMTPGRGTNPDGTQMDESVVRATMPVKTSDTIEPMSNDGSLVDDNSAQFTFTDERWAGGSTVPEDQFTFTQPGTYRYLIAETNPNAATPGSGILGVTYDQTQYRLTVVVEDDGAGSLKVTDTGYSKREPGQNQFVDIADDQEITFTNTYSTEQVGISFNAAKVLENRDTAMADNEFTFHMEFAGWMTNADFDAQADTWSMDGDVAEKAPTAAADKGNIIRGDVIFDNVMFTSDNVGYTYRYAITEIIPDDATNAAYEGVTYGRASADQKADAGWTKDGVTYDGSTKYVTAKVTSDQVEDENNPGTFVEVVRVATGGEAPYNEQTGRFEGGAIFTNTYGSTGSLDGKGDAAIKATKTLNGRDMKADEFDFVVKDKQGNEVARSTGHAAAEDGQAADITFSPIDYNSGDLEQKAKDPESTGVTKNGNVYTITYTVSEKINDLASAGVTPNDPTSYEITVTVTDNNKGTMTAEVSYPKGMDSLSFVNVYDEIEGSDNAINVSGKKILTSTMDGVDAPKLEGGEFTFTITGKEVNADGSDVPLGHAAPMPETATVQNADDGTVSFGSITYTVDNVWGSNPIISLFAVGGDQRDAYFKYTITETGSMGGVTNAGEQSFIVHVHDDGKGNVTAKVVDAVGTEMNAPYFTFENTYSPDPAQVSGQESFQGTKIIEGRNGQDGEQFGFTLSNANNDTDTGDWSSVTLLDQDNKPVTGEDGAPAVFDTLEATASMHTTDNEAAFWFGNLSFAKPGTYTFNVTETSHDGEQIKGIEDGTEGMTYDRHVGVITVEVSDNGSGTLQAEVTPGTIEDGADENDLTFENAYSATSTVNDAEGEVAISATKTLAGRDLNKGEFTFQVKNAEGKVVSTGTNAAADEGKAAQVTFGTISYNSNELDELAAQDGSGVTKTVDEGTGLATYTIAYTVSEVTDGLADAGVTEVKAGPYDITVTLADNGDGTMTAKVGYPEGSDSTLSFQNKYEETNVPGEGNSVKIAGTKTVTSTMDGVDAPKLEGGEFTFTLKGEDGAPMPADSKDGVKTVPNNADGTVDFGTIEYTVDNTWGITPFSTRSVGGDPRDKTFTYTVIEEGSMPGVENEGGTKTIKVTVHDDGKGNLTVTTDPEKAPLFSFTNTYNPGVTDFDPNNTEAGIAVTKNVTGNGSADQMHKDGYGFTLMVENVTDGVEDPATGFNKFDGAATSDADGNVVFNKITFTQAGTYKVTVTENLPSGAKDEDEKTPGFQYGNVTYDQHELMYTVTVTDNKETGKLEATVEDGSVEGASVFTNVYYDEEDAKEVTSDKGNGSMAGVGDVLTYTVDWANNAVDENGAPTKATVTVTDKVPAGTELDEKSISEPGVYDPETGEITWTFDNADAAATGTVSFQVTVTEDAVNHDPITNQATITVGENDPHQTNEVTTDFPKKTSEDSTPDTGIQVGDTLTYTIEWANLEDTEQNVTITDILPEGLTYVDGSAAAVENGSFKAEGQTLTWTFPAQPGATGTVTFKALVNENATTVTDPVKNTATVTVGNNTYQTNTTDGDKQPGTGSLTISKEIKLTEGQGNEIDADKEFTFTLELKDAAGNALTGEFPVKDAETTVKNGATVTLKHGESLTVEGLPEGAKVTVTEDPEPGYTADEATKTVTIEADETAEAAFVNTYKTDGSTDVPTEGEGAFQLTKVLTGKKWATGDNADAFTFELTPTGGTLATGEAVDPATQPMPTDANGNAVTATTVSAPTGTDAEGNDQARFSFGTITYTAAGTYTYEVTERPGTNAGMDYDGHTAKVTVTVSDNKQGRYTASATVENGTFTNVYSTELDFGAEGQGGLWVVKNLENRNIDAGQFEFTVTAADEASAKKAGFDGMTKVVKSTAGTVDVTEDGKQVATSWAEIFSDATFTQDDTDDTYTYTVKETKGGEAGYTNDATEYTVTITTADDGNGGIKVTTHVTAANGYDKTYVYDNDESTADEQAVVPFTNVYQATGELGGDGEGSVGINATKQLANRDQVAGEFAFTVTDAAGTQVANGTNAANGTVSFSPISYTKDGLLADAENGVNTYGNVDGKDTFTYTYTVAEDTKSFDEGVTAIADSFAITVTVTDNNDGTLGIAVAYPDGGNGLTFRNAYGEGDEGKATVNVAGTKTLEVESGNNAPDIAGKYTFTLTGSEGAPMPEKTTATNDAAGNVNFGDVTFTMENVFGGEATEDAGDTATDQGPTADASNTDDAADKGTEAAEGAGALMTQGENSADAAAEGESDATEAVDEAAADEANATEAEADAEATDANAADPTVTQAAFRTASAEAKSAKRSKTFTYTVTESGQVAGVTNDAQASRTFTVTVTDNGDGTLSVATDPASGAKFSFTNTYRVQPSDPSEPTDPKPGDESGKGWVAVNKTISGRDLAEGEFQFALTGIKGTPSEGMVSTGTNTADGSVTLGEGVVFNAPGTYEFTIAEVAGDKSGVTYDQTAYVAVATVTDNGDGTLAVSWEVTDAYAKPVENVTFENGYEIVRPGTVDFGAAKILDGRDLAEGEFSFELKDADGKVVQTAKNAADGSVAFEPMSFAKAGTYTYTISEVLPTDDDPDTEGVQDDGVTYDATVFTAVVTVVDNGDGSTSASVAYENDAQPRFTNVYVKPAEPEPSVPAEPAVPSEPETPAPEEPEAAPEEQLPVTGDYLPMVAGGIAVAAAGLVAGGVALRKRQRRGEE